MNLGKFTGTLANMKMAMIANVWNSPRLQPNLQKATQAGIVPPAVIANGVGVMQTVDIAEEVVREPLSGHALTGMTNLWFDGEAHRVINRNLEIVHDVLLAVVRTVTSGQPHNLSDYLIHVNDMDANASMVRPHGQNFSYFSSQLALIDKSGNVYSVAMDRVRGKVAALTTSYIWRALSISEGCQLSVTHPTTDGVINVEPAMGYAHVHDLKIAIFARNFSAFAKRSGNVTEYAYRDVPAKPTPPTLVRPIQRQGLNGRAPAAFHDPA
jgi:hypothetical protein